MIHGNRANGKAHGVVNTKVSVVSKMLDLVNYKADVNLSKIKILEPSAGTGAFALEIIDRLYHSSKTFEFNFEDSLSNIYLCEVNEEIFQSLNRNVKECLSKFGISEIGINLFVKDFLLVSLNKEFDIIIGNPPYVRNENIPYDLKVKYQSKFSTFTHRSDLYIPFYEKSLGLLRGNGMLSFVCSNRWLKNQYGIKLRELITKNYKIESIIDLEKADIFDEDVLGYPAVTIISNKNQTSFSPYSEVSDLESFLDFEQNSENSISLNLTTSNWFSYSYKGDTHEKFLSKIEEQNFKIGIGVATGRDSIFIGKSFDGQIEKELLIPILTSKDVKNDEIDWNGNYLINPYDKQGNLIKLEQFPLANNYFKKNKNELSKRHVAKKDLNKFYKTIDKIHYHLIVQPKVILPDISGNRFINVDEGNYYPHHNLYFITGGTYDQMCLLASILMSDFTYQQLLHIGNKMKGGYPRWQAQNLRKLRIPIINAIPNVLKDSLLEAYHSKDLKAINSIITPEQIANFKIVKGQGVLFEPKEEYRLNSYDRKKDH